MSCRFALAATLFAASACGFSSACSAAQLGDVEHIIVIHLENHSFDNLFGFFPGADGIATAGATKIQVDRNGKPYDFLPPAMEAVDLPHNKEVDKQLPADLLSAIKKFDKRMSVDRRFPDNPPNQPFSIDAYVPLGDKTGDPIHRFYHQQAQIDGGLMDKFVAYTNVGALVMGYYDGSRTNLWKYAERYTLADHFFQAAFGGSFLNHFWWICACTPRYDNAPDKLKAGSDVSGPLRGLPDQVTPDGYAVNTLQPFDPPHNEKEPTLPPQDMATIGDELSDKGISWAWYAGGWKEAVENHPDKTFQYHHQPFAYFRKYAPGQPGREHLKDEEDFEKAIAANDLPEVVFYKPIGELNEHPGYADVLEGDKDLGKLLSKIERSPISRRERWLLGPRPPAEDRSLGPQHAHPHRDHLALRQEEFHRPHNLRYDRDLEAYRVALRARVFGRPRQEVKGSDQRLRLRRPSARAGLQTLESGGVRN